MKGFILSTLIPALLAGGLAGQLVSVVGGSIMRRKREHHSWLKTERSKLFFELLTITTNIPKTEDARNNWTYDIRSCSQKIHILYETGTAPAELADTIEQVFQHALLLKKGNAPENWSEEQRNSVRQMRIAMAHNMNVS